MALVIASKKEAKFVVVDLFGKNPCCASDK
jgi:hypothetical protein